ncbi:MAG: DUF2703 domain-containing protein, partial [Candidatus Bathyarchaeota archaeon]|nr:DUF2703 domain-containing protein [Candidatus Bathyarchaeota archaeon]
SGGCCSSANTGCCDTGEVGCCGASSQAGKGSHNSLFIKWKRLVNDDGTCPRCGSTEEQLDRAVVTLGESLTSLGIDVVVEKVEMSVDEFKKKPLESNSIWLNDQLLEDLVGAVVGQSPCCDVCGSSDCRTVSVDDQVYETIPSELIVKAGLVAASRLIGSMEKSCC